jgi:hypothetical protein
MAGFDGRLAVCWALRSSAYLGFVLSVLQFAKSSGLMGKNIRLLLLKCSFIVTLF